MLYNLFPSDSFMLFISGDLLNPSSAVLIAGLMMQVWLFIACKDRKTCLSERSIFLPFLDHMTRQACCLLSRKHLMNFPFLASFDLKNKKKNEQGNLGMGSQPISLISSVRSAQTEASFSPGWQMEKVWHKSLALHMFLLSKMSNKRHCSKSILKTKSRN